MGAPADLAPPPLDFVQKHLYQTAYELLLIAIQRQADHEPSRAEPGSDLDGSALGPQNDPSGAHGAASTGNDGGLRTLNHATASERASLPLSRTFLASP